MGEQAPLFDFGPPDPPPISAKRLSAKRNPRQDGPVRLQLTMDERADETRFLAELYGQLNAGRCPIAGRPDGPRRCPLRECREHLMVKRNGDDLKTEAELETEWALMPYHCIRDFIRDHPHGATEEEIGEAMRTSRQTVQDDLEKAIEEGPMDWQEEFEGFIEAAGFNDLPRAWYPDRWFMEEWFRQAAEEMRERMERGRGALAAATG